MQVCYLGVRGLGGDLISAQMIVKEHEVLEQALPSSKHGMCQWCCLVLCQRHKLKSSESREPPLRKCLY